MSTEDQMTPLRPILFFAAVNFFILLPFFTANNIQELASDSINYDYKESWDGFTWSGYTSLVILNWTNAVVSWFMPPLIAILNSRRSLSIGTFLFNLSLVTFLFPFKYGLYTATIISGLGTSLIWSSQGAYLSSISNDASITRDTGINWSTFQGGAVLGNIFVAYMFQGQEHIASSTRNLIYSCFIVSGVIGIIATCFLNKPKTDEKSEPVLKVFVRSIKILATKRMFLLTITCFYSGLETSFFATLYGTSVGYTKSFGVNRKTYAGETGMLIGAGQVCAGLLLIITRRMKKPEYILLLAYLISVSTFGCIYLNLPDKASIEDTADLAIIHSSLPLALVCAYTLGFCDGCFETQIFRFIIKHYPENVTSPFAVYTCSQAIAMGGMYLFGNYFGLHFHCIMLAITCTVGTAAFFLSNNVKDKGKDAEKDSITDKIQS